MLYRLMVGTHKQDGKLYKKGDEIETDVNLISTFRGKFTKVHPSDADAVVKAAKAPIPEKKKSPPKAESGEFTPTPGSAGAEVSLGPDMTVTFPDAKDTGLKLHKTGENFHIVSSEGDILTKGGALSREDAVMFLKNNKDA